MNINTPGMGTYGAAWECAGYCGGGQVGELFGSLSGRPAIVAGNAEGVFQEVLAAQERLDDPVIFAVNDVGCYLPRLDHWCSLHVDNLEAWKAVRWLHPREKEVAKYHSIEAKPHVDYAWEQLTPLFALSGYFAMQVAYLMGADRIVLCGCPGNAKRKFYEARPREDFSYGSGWASGDRGVRDQVEQEMARLPEFKRKVRSLSGWSRDFFGGV